MSLISRSTSPVLALSGISLVAAIWLGLSLGLSHDYLSDKRKKRKKVKSGDQEIAQTTNSAKKLTKRRISSSTSRLLKDQVSVSVSGELEQVIKECNEMVDAISKDCRSTNRKFRDIEFDLASDPDRTFYGLVDIKDPNLALAPEVRRVTDIFDRPKFFSDRPGHHDIHQGNVSDCWFLSALSTVATYEGYIQRVCVARDEEVGVYGFVFQRNGRWVSVIIDDQLFWSLPRFEGLAPASQELYHNDKELFKTLTRNTGQSLYHAHSGLQGETWVPLIEKAFAKLHGDFNALNWGWVSQGLEDLTGGVSVILNSSDILDPDRFWTSELLPTNPPSPSRLIGVSFQIAVTDTDNPYPTVEGLVNNHAYSVLRARECQGRRFVVLRNPWGKKEWTGAWGDGSKFWTDGLGHVKGKNAEKEADEKEESKENWSEVLKELDHVLGDDGEFVMEYKDFLATWHRIEITTLLDSNWVVSSHWLQVPPQHPIHPWAYGDLNFSFTLPYASKAHVVLSQIDSRYFRSLSGMSMWGFDFVLYRRGDTIEEWECQGSSYCGLLVSYRSVSWQGELEAGEYIVWPRLDRWGLQNSGDFEDKKKKWDPRTLSRVLMNRTISRAMASNYESSAKKRYIPKTVSDVILENRKEVDMTETLAHDEHETQTQTKVVVAQANYRRAEQTQWPAAILDSGLAFESDDDDEDDSSSSNGSEGLGNRPGDIDIADAAPVATGVDVTGDDEDERSLWLGLKVYTVKHGEEAVVIEGWVKEGEDRTS